MDIALVLLKNLFPLYILIGFGFVAGRWCNVDRHSLANLAIYICSPLVVFGFIAQLEFKAAYILLPFIIYAISAIVAFALLFTGRKVYGDNRANLVAMCASMGNTGYFGLPLVLLLFKPDWVAVYMFMMIGPFFFEATVGYYLAARGNFSVHESIRKVVRYPTLYAIAAGLVVNFLHLQIPPLALTYWTYFKGCYVVLGMMIIGVSLSKIDRLVIGPRFTALSFLGKFFLWPILAALFAFADTTCLHIFPPEIHMLLIIIAVVPPGANIAAFAAQMNLEPEKAATTVLLGTFFALIYIPLICTLFHIRPVF